MVDVELKNNTDEEQTVFLDYTPHIFRDAPGKWGANRVNYHADLTPNDGVSGTYVTIAANDSEFSTYYWKPHLDMPANVGPYNAELEVKSDRYASSHDIETISRAFYIKETGDCESPGGYPDTTKFHVNRDGEDC